jgi:hypothetical protein
MGTDERLKFQILSVPIRVIRGPSFFPRQIGCLLQYLQLILQTRPDD